MKRHVGLMITLVMLLAVFTGSISAAAQDTTQATQTAPQTPESAEAWREDFLYLVGQMMRTHPEYDRYTSAEAYDNFAHELNGSIPTMTDAQIIVALMEYVADLHDGHSHLFPAIQEDYSFTAYPLVLYPFADGVYLIDAAPQYAEWIGARLVAINGVPAEEVIARLARLMPNDNKSGGKVLMPVNLATAEVLFGMGITTDADSPGFVLEAGDGTQTTLDPARIRADEYLTRFPEHWRLPRREAVMSQNRLSEIFWWTPLNDSGTILYVQYNGVLSLNRTLTEFRSVLESQPVERLILDIRYNGGGDIAFARPLLNLLREDDRFAERGSLIILTARNTFSAAVVFSLWLQADPSPVFIGEPSGGRPRMFENNRPITLPNSRLRVYLSTRARTDVSADDPRVAIDLDVLIPFTAADYFAGRDAALEAAVAYEA